MRKRKFDEMREMRDAKRKEMGKRMCRGERRGRKGGRIQSKI